MSGDYEDFDGVPLPLELAFAKTERGFVRATFRDYYGHGCSIQASSLAYPSAVWFGIDDAAPMVMASHAASLGVKTDAREGWVPYPISDEVLMHTRMHLTQEQVRALLPALQRFAETGELTAPATPATGAGA